MARIVLVGAGHTHVELARCGSRFVRAGHELVLISPEAEHAYSGMGPGMLGGIYSLEQIQLPASVLMRKAGALFLQGTVTGNDPGARTLTLSTGETVGYDLLSINVGSELAAQPGSGQSIFGRLASKSSVHYPVKPITHLAEARTRIEHLQLTTGKCRVAVVGGGPAGVELAGNAAWLLYRLRTAAHSGRAAGGGGEPVDLYASGGSLAGLTAGRRRYVESHLSCHGVRIHYGARLSTDQIADGLDADVVLVATGIRPARCLETFGLPIADDGAVRVDNFLRAVDHRHIFAVGDSACFVEHPLDRVGVYAVRMQRVLIENLLTAAGGVAGENRGHSDRALTAFTATGPYLGGLNLGFDRGILYRGRWELRGRAAFLIKDAIDRRFMQRYQRTLI